MAKSMEEILGPLEREPRIPGTRENEGERIRYVSSVGGSPADEFGKIIMQVKPPFVRSGA